MNKDILAQYRSLSAEDRELVNKATAALHPCASCGVVEFIDLALSLLNRLGLNNAEALIMAIASNNERSRV